MRPSSTNSLTRSGNSRSKGGSGRNLIEVMRTSVLKLVFIHDLVMHGSTVSKQINGGTLENTQSPMFSASNTIL